MFGLQDRSNLSLQQYWKNLQIGFKYLLLITVGIGVIGVFNNLFLYIFADKLVWTVNKFQIWRIFTSFLADPSIINLLFNVLILNTCLPSLEKMYSTAYVIGEIFLQTCLCNIIFIILAEISVLLGLVNSEAMVIFGLSQLMFIFLWQLAAMNPQEQTRFCFFPFTIPMKYLPWCFFLFLLLFGGNIGILIGCMIGQYQHMILNHSLIRLPLSIYNKIESMLPKSTKQNSGFVSIRSVQANLLSICRDNASVDSNQCMNDRVEVLGSGVSIGGGERTAMNYKHYWAEQEELDQSQTKLQEDSRDNNQLGNETSRNLSNTNLI